MEAIYNDSDHNYNFEDDKKQQRVRLQQQVKMACRVGISSHLILQRIYFDLTRCNCGKTSQDCFGGFCV